MSGRETLSELSIAMLEDPDVADRVSTEVRDAQWMGYSGCSDKQIAAGEERLRVKFPPSLREFYSISNGWRDVNSFVYAILPIEKIDYLPIVDPGLAEVVSGVRGIPGDPQYFDEQVTAVMRSIVLSTEGDATTTLIDPQSDVGNGEWNVGTWASWHPAMEWSNMDWWSYLESQGPTCF